MFDNVICNIQSNSQRNQKCNVTVTIEITFTLVVEKLRYAKDVSFLYRSTSKHVIVEF